MADKANQNARTDYLRVLCFEDLGKALQRISWLSLDCKHYKVIEQNISKSGSDFALSLSDKNPRAFNVRFSFRPFIAFHKFSQRLTSNERGNGEAGEDPAPRPESHGVPPPPPTHRNGGRDVLPASCWPWVSWLSWAAVGRRGLRTGCPPPSES